jgi:hypothetical protein
VKLGLVEDQPATRPAFATSERTGKLAAQVRSRYGVPRRRSWGYHQLPINDLADNIVRQRAKIRVRGRSSLGKSEGHGSD